jgi:chromosome segregation ATPase
MRIEQVSRIALLALLIAGSSYAVRAQQDSSQQPPVDPVAAAAKKARAEQKAEPKPKKVYTNDDFSSSARPAPATDSNAQADKKDATADTDADKDKDDKDKKADAKGEEYWHKRFAETRDKLASAEKELDVLHRELEKDQVQYYPDPQKAMEQQFNRSEINEKRGKIDAKEKEIDGLKQKLSDMEDDLRRAGGDPGWAR